MDESPWGASLPELFKSKLDRAHKVHVVDMIVLQLDIVDNLVVLGFRLFFKYMSLITKTSLGL